MNGPRIFLAEDDGDLRGLFGDALRKQGYDVTEAADGAALLEHLSAVAAHKEPRPHAIVMDIRMPYHSGIDLLLALRLAEWDVPILLMTAFSDDYVRRRANDLGATLLLDKPLSAADLVRAVGHATGQLSGVTS